MEQRAQRGVERGSVIAHYESSILTRSGERRLFSWNNTLLRDANGDVVGQASVGEDITDRRRAEHELERLAFHDPLTGLPNRILFHEHLDVALARAQRAGCGVAVLYVDLDDFKLVNDSFGHNAGDELLCEVAARLTGSTRAADVVARQGGDEFLILIADVETTESGDVVDVGDVARRVAEQVRTALQRPLILADTEIYTSASLGISLYPADAPDAESLLKHADIAMYKAKESGRDGYQLFSSNGHDPRAQLSMAGRLRRAVERDQLMLALPAAGVARDRRVRRSGGAAALAGRSERPGHAGRLHSAGRAHRADRPDLGVGDRRRPAARAPSGARWGSTCTCR